MSARLLATDPDGTPAMSVLQRFNDKMFKAAHGLGMRLVHWCGLDPDLQTEDVARLVVYVSMALLLIEDIFILTFWHLGKLDLLVWVNIGQLAFVALAIFFEVVSYSVFRGSARSDEVVQTILGVNIACLKVPVELFWLLSFAPNYVHVINMAGAAGSAYNVWDDSPHAAELRNDFHRNWKGPFFVGSFISDAGIPNIMTALLIASVLVHLTVAASWMIMLFCEGGGCFVAGEIADAANLQFLGRCAKLVDEPDLTEHNPLSRLFFSSTIKYALIWAKNSFTSVMWPYMGNDMRFTMLLALCLAWYGVLQLMPQFAKTAKFAWGNPARGNSSLECFLTYMTLICFVLLCLGLLQQGLHTAGIFWCDSHDFSVIHGCTAVDSA